jgi:hypothetical protein
MRIFVGLALGAIVCGCMSQQVIPADEKKTRQFAGRSITSTKREAPGFQLGNASYALLNAFGLAPGLVGAGLMTRPRDAIVAAYGIDDPAGYVSDKLIADLSQHYHLTRIEPPSDPVTEDSPKKLATQFSSVRYLLDVRTEQWGLMSHPMIWTQYFVIYNAQLRIIDTSDGKVIAQTYCRHGFDKPGQRPTREEIFSNQAQQVKDELRENADKCIEEFETLVLEH